jgi:hypothetical protein
MTLKPLMIPLALVVALALGACSKEASEAPAEPAPQAAAKPAAAPAPAKPAPVEHKTATETLKYHCADAPDTLLDRPGKCSDGSLAAAVVEDGVEAEYFCPMCAGQESAEPGKCGKCGMFLSARVKGASPASDEGHEGHDHEGHEGHDH